MPTRLSKNTAGNKKRRPLGRCFPIRSEADIKVLCSAAHFPAGRPTARRCLAGDRILQRYFLSHELLLRYRFPLGGFFLQNRSGRHSMAPEMGYVMCDIRSLLRHVE